MFLLQHQAQRRARANPGGWGPGRLRDALFAL